MTTRTRGEHMARHRLLHRHLDELLADFIHHTKRMPSDTTVMDFTKWSFEQTLNPAEPQSEGGS